MTRRFLGWLFVGFGSALAARAAALPAFDFRTGAGMAGWTAQHDVARLEGTAEGMAVQIGGADPYLAGPARDYPAGTPLWLNVRMRSDSGGTAQVFYFRDGSGPTEPASVRFAVAASTWVTVRVPMPALGPRHRLRLDPPGETGRCVYERLWFDERILHAEPAWPVPEVPPIGETDPAVASGDLRLVHGAGGPGHFVLEVSGSRVAFGQARPLIGYVMDGRARWWTPAAAVGVEVTGGAAGVRVRSTATDPDGARWEWEQVFRPGARVGTVEFEASFAVDRDRSVLHFPVVTVFAGVGTTGPRKQQALLAGVEYLEDEPSSSEADLEGPQARRQVTDTARLTMPLAAVVADGRYLGLTWEMEDELAVVFDSPDRLYRSGGHVMGLVIPGSDGLVREEGSLVPYDPVTLAAGRRWTVRGAFLGGAGTTAVAAVRHYVASRGLPDVPPPPEDAVGYYRLAGRGWLESQIRSGDLFRHAAPGSFGAQPAADAAFYMDWLAGRVGDPDLAVRLEGAAASAMAKVPAGQSWIQQVGHVRFPVAPLVFGAVGANADAAREHGRSLLRRFEREGTVRYRAPAGGIDYGRTHWTNEANGLTAQVVQLILEDAAFSGDRSLAETGLAHLRALSKFRGTVPRGAQTWEIPLHTPDILASAHLVRAYTLGYEWSGDPGFLDEARYWAWTGIPFVYLRSPASGRVGVYATTPVLGATQWIAPNWIGLPVQWCGLVYGEALYRLARHDPGGPWRQVADGIASSGVAQTYPATDGRYLGLLPDSFSLRPQQRNPANINPATLLASATRWYGAGPVYDSWSFRHHGVIAHAAGEIHRVREDAGGFAFEVAGWPRKPHRVLLTGMTNAPTAVKVNGASVPLTDPNVFDPRSGRLVLPVTGSPAIEVIRTAKTALRIESGPADGARVSWVRPDGPVSLESADRLTVDAPWSVLEATPRFEGGKMVVDLRLDGPARFFRLRSGGG